MITRLIRGSFGAPLLSALLIAASTVVGTLWLLELPRDVFPDLSAPVFNGITQNR
jgi:cobalt-zinc-cadmium resistance protein CzcA